MRILIEGYQYPVSLIDDIEKEVFSLSDHGKRSPKYVGYYFSKECNDILFIYPKILLKKVGDNFFVFGKMPEEILNPSSLTIKQLNFLQNFAVLIHRTILLYRNTHESSGIVYVNPETIGRRTSVGNSATLIDIIYSFIKFQRENENFFSFIINNINENNQRINWRDTIKQNNAYICDGTPIYMSHITIGKEIDHDEALISLFFSILFYIYEKYGIKSAPSVGIKVIRGKEFEKFLNGYGITFLRQNRNRYFSDIMIEIWELCYSFFNKLQFMAKIDDSNEYLFAENFNIVFEAIIDDLISDSNLPKGLKDQDDGKLVDHLYLYPGIFNTDDIYYIGDSKYYREDVKFGRETVAKQFTYARNIIQWNIDLFNDPNINRKSFGLFGDVHILDDKITEGYNIIPNFFISAILDDDLCYLPNIIFTNKDIKTSFQFKDRLFDRDTLYIFHCKINFLFIISLYARNKISEKCTWKEYIRKEFKQQIVKILQNSYNFYAFRMKNKPLDEFINANFKLLLGKIYRPFPNKEIIFLALKKESVQHTEIIERLIQNCDVIKCELGDDPEQLFKDQSKFILSPSQI